MAFVRLVPLLLPSAAFLVLSTAQRMLLLWLLSSRLHPRFGDAFEVLARGARTDLALLALVVAPLAAWCSLLPERAWRSRLHRRLAFAGLAASFVALLAWISVDGLQFWVHHARLSHPLRERLLVAWRLLAGEHGPARLTVVLGIACLVTGLLLALLLRKPFDAAFSRPAPALFRARDLVLAVAACVLAFALRPHGVAFPGAPVLDEIAGSSVPAVARAAWSRLSRVSSRACTSPSSEPPGPSRAARPGSTRAARSS